MNMLNQSSVSHVIACRIRTSKRMSCHNGALTYPDTSGLNLIICFPANNSQSICIQFDKIFDLIMRWEGPCKQGNLLSTLAWSQQDDMLTALTRFC
jgi:hypothetical protein